ncbi:MAG: hypothetical protein LBS33_00445 [Streptococcaceae bacterium]|jgi:membrane protein insertase Oxa1/YidC/SpoIIIJ|nr:hypothetical protein [Streptococcaceae bacterium]
MSKTYRIDKRLTLALTLITLAPISIGILFWSELPQTLSFTWPSSQLALNLPKASWILLLPIVFALATYFISKANKNKQGKQSVLLLKLALFPVLSNLINLLIYLWLLKSVDVITIYLLLLTAIIYIFIAVYSLTRPKSDPKRLGDKYSIATLIFAIFFFVAIIGASYFNLPRLLDIASIILMPFTLFSLYYLNKRN